MLSVWVQTITTTTEYVEKDSKPILKPKLALKWMHESGFAVDKLELSPECKMTVETSLTGAVPGLKVSSPSHSGFHFVEVIK